MEYNSQRSATPHRIERQLVRRASGSMYGDGEHPPHPGIQPFLVPSAYKVKLVSTRLEEGGGGGVMLGVAFRS